jgi:hypothetical protein
MMTDITRAVDLLQELVNTGRELLDALRRKTEALAATDLKRIVEVIAEEEVLAQRFACGRDALRTMVTEASDEEALHEPTLTKLIEGSAEPVRVDLLSLKRELSKVMREIELVNVTNGIVSRRSLRHFCDMLGLLSGAGRADRRYTASGSLTQRLRASNVVNHIA